MLFFPQLSTGAAAQYPIRNSIRRRTVATELAGGQVVRWLDSGFTEVHWHMALHQLTEAEMAGLEEFFRSTEGSLRTFTFADPTANLLAWSESLPEAVWHRDPMIAAAGGSQDPLGSNRGTTLVNSAGTWQEIRQGLALPGWHQYCLSAYLRSDTGGRAKLAIRSGAATVEREFPLGTDWRRCEMCGNAGEQAEGITFAIALEANSSAQVFGIQAEAGSQASTYKRSTSRSGVYTATRFGQDVLPRVTWGEDDHETQVHLVSC